jgi:hypothetical protein
MLRDRQSDTSTADAKGGDDVITVNGDDDTAPASTGDSGTLFSDTPTPVVDATRDTPTSDSTAADDDAYAETEVGGFRFGVNTGDTATEDSTGSATEAADFVFDGDGADEADDTGAFQFE